MMRICLLFMYFMCFTAYGAASSDFSALLNAVHSMQADFKQTTYDNHGKAVQTSYGKMALERPGKFRWEIKKPIPQLIVANNTKLWIYDPDLEQVTIRALHHATGDAPALLLSHQNAAIDKDFIVSAKANAPQSFILKPRSADNMFASVQMVFAGDTIKEMSLEDHLGHITNIQFQHIQSNTDLPATLFNFKPPANTDVIDETRKK